MLVPSPLVSLCKSDLGLDYSLSKDLPDLGSNKDEIRKLCKMVLKLFKHWDLTSAEQLKLFGLNPNNRSSLSRYKKGTITTLSIDLKERIGLLLAIHKNLRSLYPENKELCYSWIKKRNSMLFNFSPLEIMIRKRIIGIHYIVNFSDQLITR